MRTLAAFTLASLVTFTTLHGQAPAADAALGTWTGPARCLHRDGETLTLVITRDADGALRGATDWARSGSDGSKAAPIPLTTLTVEGPKVAATYTQGARTIRLEATIKDGTMTGGWASVGDDDRWTFSGKKKV